MFQPASASTFLLQSLIRAVEELGIDRTRLLEQLELPADRLEGGNGRIPLSCLHTLWPWLRSETGHGATGLRLAASIRPEMWDTFGRALGASVSLGDALVRAGRFIPLLTDSVELHLEVRGDRAAIAYRGRARATAHPDSVEFALGVIVHFARCLGARNVPIETVRFAHDPPDDLRLHRATFGDRIEFGRAHNAIVVQTEILHARIPGHDVARCALMERDAELCLSALPRPESLVRRTEESLLRELHAGTPTVERVAESLGMRSRTLSRRLRAEGSTFQEVLDALRHGLADRYLSEGDMSITEVAYALGYSDPSAFNKAFRRWTGRAPQDYRRHAM